MKESIPPVMRITFPDLSGMSVSTLKDFLPNIPIPEKAIMNYDYAHLRLFRMQRQNGF